MRNFFISTDDTGMCETVMLSEQVLHAAEEHEAFLPGVAQPDAWCFAPALSRPPSAVEVEFDETVANQFSCKRCDRVSIWEISPIEFVAYCEILERRHLKALLRIWLKSNSSSPSFSTGCTSAPINTSVTTLNAGSGSAGIAHSPSSPGHSSVLFSSSNIRFKNYDFDTDTHTAEQIHNKLNCVLEMRSSDPRREFLLQRDRKQEKRQLKL